MMNSEANKLFDLSDRVAVVTGGVGFLGMQHAQILHDLGAKIVLMDLNASGRISNLPDTLKEDDDRVWALDADITSESSLEEAKDSIIQKWGRIDILINNAANNAKVEKSDGGAKWDRLEHFSLEQWNQDMAVGLSGSFLCSRIFGAVMAEQGAGVILNIASDLALIGPNQKIYREKGAADDAQPVKPVTYCVVKSGLIGLTRYLATYWAESGVRVNALCPGGVENGQPEDFVGRLAELIPMGRMARKGEYQGAVAFMCSDASSYMTGSIVSIDGGRTCW